MKTLPDLADSMSDSIPVDFTARPAWTFIRGDLGNSLWCNRHSLRVSDCPCPPWSEWIEIGDDPFAEHAPTETHESLLAEWRSDDEGFLPEVPDDLPEVVPGMTEPDCIEVARRVARFAGGKPLSAETIETVPLPIGVTIDMAIQAVRWANGVLAERRAARAAGKAMKAELAARVARAEAQLRQAGAISGARGQRLAQWLREKYRQETVH